MTALWRRCASVLAVTSRRSGWKPEKRLAPIGVDRGPVRLRWRWSSPVEAVRTVSGYRSTAPARIPVRRVTVRPCTGPRAIPRPISRRPDVRCSPDAPARCPARGTPSYRRGSPPRRLRIPAPCGPRGGVVVERGAYGESRWRSRGKRTASRMLFRSSIVITSRSAPSPQPAWGGIP